MTVSLVMNARNEQSRIASAIRSAASLIDSWIVCDTGSVDGTVGILADLQAEIPGEIVSEPWVDYGHNRTVALAHARDTDDWLLWVDADMTAVVHPDLKDWLESDPDPDTDAWDVEVLNHGLRYRLPLLVRGGLDWRYVGRVHEYLDPAGRKFRPLIGLSFTHHGEGRGERLEEDLELLREGYEAGIPRDAFYYAECLRLLGRTDEAIVAYQFRDQLGDWEEEAWFSAYQAARLSRDVQALLDAYERRPWRHEPLTAAARIVSAEGGLDDVLFLEAAP